MGISGEICIFLENSREKSTFLILCLPSAVSSVVDWVCNSSVASLFILVGLLHRRLPNSICQNQFVRRTDAAGQKRAAIAKYWCIWKRLTLASQDAQTLHWVGDDSALGELLESNQCAFLLKCSHWNVQGRRAINGIETRMQFKDCPQAHFHWRPLLYHILQLYYIHHVLQLYHVYHVLQLVNEGFLLQQDCPDCPQLSSNGFEIAQT